AAATNRNTPQYPGASGAPAGYAAVRNNVDHPDMFSPQWYGEHQTIDWAGAGAWAQPTRRAVTEMYNYDKNITPIPYNYGKNVTCIDHDVTVNGQPIGTAEEFSQQADDDAERGTAAAASPND